MAIGGLPESLTGADLQFIVETLMPWEADPTQAASRLKADEPLLKSMLDDDRLFQRVVAREDILLQISPRLFFAILLLRTSRDLALEAFTVEQRGRQKVTLFDADQVVRLVEQEPIRDYLSTLLASFSRIESVLVMVETQRGRWRGYRTNELDIEGMIRYSQTLDEPFRFAPYKRIGDVCLFMVGMFPEFINNRNRYPASGRRRLQAQLCQTIEDYEAYGQKFYRLAAEHDRARLEGLDKLLNTLSENFILAEKPLTFLANRYLQFIRHTLFNL